MGSLQSESIRLLSACAPAIIEVVPALIGTGLLTLAARLRAASMRYFRRWRVIDFCGYRLISDPNAWASALHLLAAIKEVGRVMELDSKERTSSAEEPNQCPLKLGLRFSTKARTASL